jgi:hypothetical protein
MASVTLAEAAKLTQNVLVSGIIESIVSVNPMFNFLPFDSFSGNALAYNVENALGGVEFIGKGADNSIPAGAKTAATFTQKTASLVPLIGDAEVDHFVQATMSNVNDQKAIQVQSKAKSIGRKYQNQLINGDATTDVNSFDGLLKLIPSARKIYTTEIAGVDFSFELLDEMISMVLAKDGQVDYFTMSDKHIRKYYTLLRALGGAGIGEVITLPNGTQVPAYRGVPLFRNDYLLQADADPGAPDVQCSPIFAGTFDDGSRKVGLAGLTSEVNNGVFVTEVGEEEDNNNTITRVRFYCGMALFNELGIVMAQNIKV